MKIAVIGSKGMPAASGGVERHVEAVATRLAKAGHEVLVYTRPWYTRQRRASKLKAKSYKLAGGVRLIPLPSIVTKYLDAITHTLLASFDVLRRDVDIVHYHGIGPSLLLWIPKLLSRFVRPQAPLVVIATFHCQDYHHQKWNWFARLALRLGEWIACTIADETVVVSRELERYVWTAYQRKAIYVPNGVDGELRIKNYESRERLKRFRLQPNGYLLFVGRLVRHKGAHTLISAYRQLQAIPPQRDPALAVASYPATAGPRLGGGKLQASFPLVIVGAGANTSEYERELRRMARGMPIRFLGEQTGEALAGLLRGARLLVHPSVSEGMSLLLLEAMAAGTPVLSSDIPENLEVLGKTATVFRADDADDLARRLFWCLTHPKTIASRARQAQSLAKHFQWEQTVDTLVDVYEQCLWITSKSSAKMQEKLAR